eukprot:960278-Amphidinium_carterae.1
MKLLLVGIDSGNIYPLDLSPCTRWSGTEWRGEACQTMGYLCIPTSVKHDASSSSESGGAAGEK